ncbi:MAG: 16S rRNA (guanine(527)-N(7))-methyltransferase RsmG [Proteobacteria bacterium]|nr:16S rRNA (guanine(527)-N(7))-methyltransferase RsmG [Pseudomonadota bacterium]
MTAGLPEYKKLLIKWQGAINLIGPDTVDDIEQRHFEDSLQLAGFIPAGKKILLDLGSGAGFPGMVLAMARPDMDVHLIESDHRKCTFLSTVSRETKTPVTIHNLRIEDMPAEPVPDIITARALAPLPRLLEWCAPWADRNPDLVLFFLKGQGAAQEIAEARKGFNFSVEEFPSKTDPKGRALKVTNVCKKKN